MIREVYVLVIRNDQIEKFIRGDEDSFVEHLVTLRKEEDPEIATEYDDTELRNMVRLGIKKAEGYGFDKSKDQSAFVAIMFEIAPNFDTQPEINSVLKDETIDADAKFEKLWSPAVPDEVWEKAADEYDEAAWQNPPKKETELKK